MVFKSTKSIVIAACAVLYLWLVRRIRYNRSKQIAAMPDPALAADAFQAARKIIFTFYGYEFPFMATLSLQFGLFRTYGIPSISKILAGTRQLTDDSEIARRYEDTDLILSEIGEHEPTSTDGQVRMLKALGRLNFLHSHYPITNDDYLYTLTVFICEPLRWIERYEWRKPTEIERQSSYIYWREIGIRMGIKHIPDTLEGVFEFNEQYEKDQMRFSEANKKVADGTVKLFLSTFPPIPGLRSLGNVLLRGLIDDRLCEAFGFTPAPLWAQNLVKGILHVRGFFIRHFFLPRWFRSRRTPEKPMKGTTDKYCPLFKAFENIYPNGYKIETLGPKKFENDPSLGPIYERTNESIKPSSKII